MTTEYEIRPAVAGEVEAIVALDRLIELAPHWSMEQYFAALHKWHGSSLGSGAGLKRCLFVAEAGQSIVGFAVGKVVFGEQILSELETVGVAESSRRLGIGDALCGAVIEWARERGALEMELEVRSASAGVIALYAGLGFVATGWRGKYYRDPVDDAVLMRLDLET